MRGALRWSGRGFIVLLVLTTLLGGAAYWWLWKNILGELPSDLTTYQSWRPPTTCRVYAANGDLVDEFYVERRVWVDIDTLPDHVWQAFVAAEDRRFFEHPGVDALGIGRAIYINLQKSGGSQGGSTITQQLVKNLIVGDEKSYERKIREAVLAWRLERELSKMDILQLYLNFVFLGSGNYGVEAAARDYFGVPAAELDPGQAALIAGLIPAPSRYSPRKNPDMAREKRAAVLRWMVEEGFVDPIDAIDYASDPVLYTPSARGKTTAVANAYVTQVRREIRRVIGADVAFREGLAVHTPYDPDLQEVAVGAVEDALEAHQARQGIRPVSAQLTPEEIGQFMLRGTGLRKAAIGGFAPPKPGDCLPVVVGYELDLNRLHAGPFTFALERELWDTPVFTGEESGPRAFRRTLTGGEVVQTCVEPSGELAFDVRPWAEGAAVVVENATGRVLALTGGYDTQIEGFVRATQARRQPGSSFKPYVYAAGIADGLTQLSIVQDAPIYLPGGNGQIWSPKNYSGGYSGNIQLRRALAASLNTVSVRLALRVGPAEIARLAREMGVQTPLRTDITIALGSSEVTPLDQAMGYVTLARMGVPVDPVYIDRLEDVRGTVVGVRGGPMTIPHGDPRSDLFAERVGVEPPITFLPGGPKARVMEAGVAYETVDMLREVVQSGTARRARVAGYDRGGKTGTTNNYVDAWYVGITPLYTVAVWIGTDGTGSLGESETGGKAALPAWIAIVDSLPDQEGLTFAVPEDIAMVPGDSRWLGIRRGHVPETVMRPLALGDAPLPGLSAGKPARTGR